MNNTSPSQVHKKLRELTEAADKLLGQVLTLLTNIKAPLFKLQSQSQYPVVASQAQSIVKINTDLEDFLKDQIEAIQILQKAKPGVGWAILDFMYGVLVDPHAKTHREEYMEKLRWVDKTQRAKELEEVVKTMTAKSKFIEPSKFYLRQILVELYTIKPDFVLGVGERVGRLLSQAESTEDINPKLLSEVNTQFLKYNYKNLSLDSLWKGLFEYLKSIFKQPSDVKILQSMELKIDKTNKVLQATARVDNGFIKISQQLSTSLQDTSSITKLIDSWNNRSAEILNNFQQIIQSTSEKQSPEFTNLLIKYFNFFNKLLNAKDAESAIAQLNKIKQLLEDLSNSIKEQTLKQPETNTQENSKKEVDHTEQV